MKFVIYERAPVQLDPEPAVHPKQCFSVAMGFPAKKSKVSTSQIVVFFLPEAPSSISKAWLKSQSYLQECQKDLRTYIFPSQPILMRFLHISPSTVDLLKEDERSSMYFTYSPVRWRSSANLVRQFIGEVPLNGHIGDGKELAELDSKELLELFLVL